MKVSCPYCGNNPVPHRFYWLTESLNILLTPLRQKLLYSNPASFFKTSRWLNGVEALFLNLAIFLGAAKINYDISLCKVRRAQVLWEEAQKRGIKMGEVLLFGKAVDTYTAKKQITNNTEPKQIVFSGLPRPKGYSNKWLDLMDDKWLLKKEFKKFSLPVPDGASLYTLRQAKDIFNKIKKPVIVKPRAGSRGRHSTTFVYNLSDLEKAFTIAKQLCFWVMVEEQLFGPVYRATIINGHLAGVLRGDPPFVTGDGISSVAALIEKKNSAPHAGVKNILADASAELFLSRQNLSLASVLPSGRTVNLTEKIGVNYGGSSSEDFEICHPDNKDLFLAAAKVLGDPIVGFDYIIPDITKSYKQQSTGFIEVNSLPFINLHHDPLLGAPRNAAGLIWDMLGW
jgi:cyanophycin synthetase